MRIKIKAILTSKSFTTDIMGEKYIRLELAEEREIPGPVVVQSGKGNGLAREIVPVISQVLRSMPVFGGRRAMIPRLTLLLTEDEWEKLPEKPDIGDEITIIVSSESISIDFNKT